MSPKSLLKYLQRSARLKIVCPNCDDLIPIRSASLFTEDKLSEGAVEFLREKYEEIQKLKNELSFLKKKKLERVARGTIGSGLGKILEKFVPILPGFPFKAEESLPLLDPIDFISFSGLSKNRIESISFMDVKSGKARLKQDQKAIKAAVERGNVSLELIKRGKL